MLDRVERNKLSTLSNAVAGVRATHPGSPPRAMVLNDAPSPVDTIVANTGRSPSYATSTC